MTMEVVSNGLVVICFHKGRSLEITDSVEVVLSENTKQGVWECVEEYAIKVYKEREQNTGNE